MEARLTGLACRSLAGRRRPRCAAGASRSRIGSAVFHCFTKSLLVLAILVVVGWAIPAQEPAYIVHDLGHLGGTDAQAYGINNRGQVVGSSLTASGQGRAFLWEAGLMRDLGLGDNSGAEAINDRGEVAGSYTGGDVVGQYAFRWAAGTTTRLPPLVEGGFSGAFSINNRSQVVGYSTSPTGLYRAVLWDGDTVRDVGVRTDAGGGPQAVAYDINERSEVVGQGLSDLGPYAFLWRNGVMVDLGPQLMQAQGELIGINNRGDATGYIDVTPILWTRGIVSQIAPAVNASGYAINESGHIAGQSSEQGFIWNKESLFILPGLPGAYSCAALDLNDRGEAVGYCFIGTGSHAVMWTPR